MSEASKPTNNRGSEQPSVDDLVASVIYGESVEALRRLAELAKLGERSLERWDEAHAIGFREGVRAERERQT